MATTAAGLVRLAQGLIACPQCPRQCSTEQSLALLPYLRRLAKKEPGARWEHSLPEETQRYLLKILGPPC